MESLDHVAHLRRELATFESYIGEDLSIPIKHCGDWNLYELVDHLGRSGLWATTAVTEKRGDHQSPPGPRDPAELAAWFKDICAGLLVALDRDPLSEAWTFYPPYVVAFWQRRTALEVLVHRWDVEDALGIDNPMDVALATDGIREVVGVHAPRQVQVGRAPAPTHAVRLTATDTGSSWVLGNGDPVATVSAPTADLLLMLWHRLSYKDHRFTWDGDREAGQGVLQGPLVP